MTQQPSRNAHVAPPNRIRLVAWLRLFTWGLLAATVAGRLGSFFFLAELFSHFSVQYIGLSALLVWFWLYTKPRLLAAVSALTLLINGLLVVPWVAAPKPTTGPPDLRLLHANVLYSGTDYARIIHLVESQSPDLFVLQEMTPESIRGVLALKKTFPYQYHIWAKGPCHILVGSRTPIRVYPSAVRSARVISLTTIVRGRELALLTVHPQTPMLPSWFANRNRQLAFVSDKARSTTLPTVILGDFNISVFSPVYQHLFDQPGLSACRRGFGLQPTWPRFLPLMFIPIDHAFVNAGFQTVNFQTLNQPGSDHQAIVVDLAFNKAGASPKTIRLSRRLIE